TRKSLVCAGAWCWRPATKRRRTLLPVDSETFCCSFGADRSRNWYTLSSGSSLRQRVLFREFWPLEKLPMRRCKALAQASSHPNWDMGQRITIDSASMFNKALELIETKEFFGISPDMIEVIVHPESLIHSMVGFNDGALMAHVGPPDMRHAIGFALNWPERCALPVERLDFAKIAQMTFRAPEEARYPALRLGRDVMKRGGLSGAVFNGAKERALDAFLAGHIGFVDMASVVEDVLTRFESESGRIDTEMTLETVMQTDHLARVWADAAMEKRAG
ncbi:UNVERIFIED_CONTAM: hypothetical protein GTU68_043567, partial [Idotea baltica]|nr:hypothetical protein [Idotea baltica]